MESSEAISLHHQWESNTDVLLQSQRFATKFLPIDHVYGTLGIVGATTTQGYSDVSKLREEIEGQGSFTYFAPSNDAWDNLDSFRPPALMKYHILNTLQCSEAIMGGAVFETLEGNTIEIGCDGDSITVNGIKMVNKKDIVTNNGVIHLIDRVLIPDSAKQVIELAGNQQTTFTDLVAQLGLASALRPDGEYTLLAPVNNAFSDDTLSMDQRLLKLILQNHILKVKVGLNELYNGQKLETIGGKQLRVFVYRTGTGIFLSLLEAADLKELLTQPGDWTLFVPTNDAFKGMTTEEKEILVGCFYVNIIHVPLSILSATKIITKFVEPKIKVIEGSLQPIIKTEGPTITKVKIEGEPELRLIKEGETVTEVIHGEPIIKKYTKIIDGVPVEITEKETREERIITGPEIKYTRISTGGGDTEETLKKLLQEEVTKVTKFIEGGDGHLFEDEDIKRLLQGDTPVRKIQTNKRVQGSRRRSRESRSQ
ncbi:PREDICTED: periostin [Propithecus coquereli]|uniref:periostin n=1 Tax=Propithecus coquereli TaxID=379532 RepID=UPI00063F1338|nr:PREDICTED: periostin [Propithecus coquereli]